MQVKQVVSKGDITCGIFFCFFNSDQNESQKGRTAFVVLPFCNIEYSKGVEVYAT